MPAAPAPPALPTDPDRLNGWKEIASFLAKGVRTAQRWERDLGLPVRRIGANGGEIVLASRAEIARWMEATAATRAAAGRAADDADEPGRSVRPRRSARAVWMAAAAAGAVALILAGAAWWRGGQPEPSGAAPRPARWRVHDDQLTVLGADGRPLWSRGFGTNLLESAYPAVPAATQAHATLIEDIDGDLAPEILFALKEDRVPSPTVHLLNADGTLRFTYTAPAERVRFGDTTYAPAWAVQGSWTTSDSTGGRSIWVVYFHKPFFPSLLVQLDAQGHVRSQYLSNGYIVHVNATRWRGRDVVMVGAANNETRGGSLAVFEGATVHGSAPAEDPRYRCNSCPAGGPDVFLTFPRTCLSHGPGETARVAGTWVGSDDTVWVDVHHGSFSRPDAAAGPVLYQLDQHLVPARAEFGGNYVRLHQQELEARRLVDHAVGPRDEAMAFPVRIWKGTRFEDLPRAPVEIDR